MLTLAHSFLAGFFLAYVGKVRDTWRVSKDRLLIVVSDRISVFDVVLRALIPWKGKVLNQLTLFWLAYFTKHVPNFQSHLVTADIDCYPKKLQKYRDQLEGRSMIVEKLLILPIEAIARGHLTGSGLEEYKKSGTVCGMPLRPGYVDSDKLDEPIYTPSTKAMIGLHDENIHPDLVPDILAKFFRRKKLAVDPYAVADELKRMALLLYSIAADYALTRGIIIADTKFEFGIRVYIGGRFELVLADEVLTPDSSRFWPANTYAPGKTQPSFDKQPVRDYCKETGWNKTEPGPDIPSALVDATTSRYLSVYEMLTGEKPK